MFDQMDRLSLPKLCEYAMTFNWDIVFYGKYITNKSFSKFCLIRAGIRLKRVGLRQGLLLKNYLATTHRLTAPDHCTCST